MIHLNGYLYYIYTYTPCQIKYKKIFAATESNSYKVITGINALKTKKKHELSIFGGIQIFDTDILVLLHRQQMLNKWQAIILRLNLN